MAPSQTSIQERVARRFEAARILVPGEGDNVDKAGAAVKMIEEHLQGIVPAVNDQDMMYARAACRAVRDLAQTLEFAIREMDPENG